MSTSLVVLVHVAAMLGCCLLALGLLPGRPPVFWSSHTNRARQTPGTIRAAIY